jgi:hypothetical protein
MAGELSYLIGRAAGFTNQKPKHTRPDGRQPYVLLHEATGAVAPGAQEILHAAQERAEARAQSEAQEQVMVTTTGRMPALEGNAFSSLRDGGVSALGHEYQQRMVSLLRRYPGGDLSRLDWMVLKDLAKAHPEASQQSLLRAMREGSPRLGERKIGHVEDYVVRTTTKVLRDLEVQQAHVRVQRADRGR